MGLHTIKVIAKFTNSPQTQDFLQFTLELKCKHASIQLKSGISNASYKVGDPTLTIILPPVLTDCTSGDPVTYVVVEDISQVMPAFLSIQAASLLIRTVTNTDAGKYILVVKVYYEGYPSMFSFTWFTLTVICNNSSIAFTEALPDAIYKVGSAAITISFPPSQQACSPAEAVSYSVLCN